MRRKFRTQGVRSIARTEHALLRVLLVLLAGLALNACVESHAIPGTHDGLDSGDGGGDGDGDIVDAGPPPPSCQATQCEGSMSMFFNGTGCCTEDDRCGLDFSSAGLEACLEREAPGQMDAMCPAASVLGIIMLPGCCARGGKCGRLVQDFAPLGCVPADVEIPIPGLEATTPASCTFTGPD